MPMPMPSMPKASSEAFWGWWPVVLVEACLSLGRQTRVT
jgi:hypothetical protein